MSRGNVLVTLANDAAGARLYRSIDCGRWNAVPSPSMKAIIRDVSVVKDGFLAVGREGEPDTGSGVGVAGIGLPAAWWSADGSSWGSVRVAGTAAAGAQITSVFPVAAGYLAVGSDAAANSSSTRAPVLWSSADGKD